MAPSSALAYMVISNNPHVHYPELATKDYKDASPEDLQMIVWAFIARFIDGGKNPNRDPKINGAMGVYEVGDSGTGHVQLFLFSKNPIKFFSLQKKFPHSNIDALKGSYDDAYAYTYKTGKHADKKHTQRCEPVIWGEWFGDNSDLPRGGIFDQIDALLSTGKKPSDIYAMGAKYAHYRGATETAYTAMLKESIPPMRTNTVTYHCGLPGTGKSYSRMSLIERYGKDEVYVVNDYSHPWDMYNYEKCVFMDELREDSLSIPELLAICDDYTCQLSCRYTNKISNWSELHIASVYPPETLFSEMRHSSFSSKQYETYEQLKRRIDYVTYHFKRDVQYMVCTISMSQYEGYDKLVNLVS